MKIQQSKDAITRILRDATKKIKEWKTAIEHYEEPYCEVSQNESGIKIKIKLPRVKKRSINLYMNNRKIEVKGANGVKNFYKSIDIPPLVDITQARASFTNDTLRILIPYTRAL